MSKTPTWLQLEVDSAARVLLAMHPLSTMIRGDAQGWEWSDEFFTAVQNSAEHLVKTHTHVLRDVLQTAEYVHEIKQILEHGHENDAGYLAAIYAVREMIFVPLVAAVDRTLATTTPQETT